MTPKFYVCPLEQGEPGLMGEVGPAGLVGLKVNLLLLPLEAPELFTTCVDT